ncbi:MAG: dynamin family protein [Ignavibacteria bacterium]|nr:dynamin family protein [Ignavibacteria bacterium]
MNQINTHTTSDSEKLKANLIRFNKEFYSYLRENDIENINFLLNKLEINSVNFAVLGQFKRGKSSFINSILGEDILPSAVLPLTSVITVVKYKKKFSAQIFFHDGSIKNVSSDKLTLYISEMHNPENTKNVKYAEVGYPNDLLKKGITFIDTPGIGSSFTSNTLLTYEYIPKIDAAILVTSPDPVLSEIEVEFLNEIFKVSDNVFIVLNKIDYLKEKELAEIIEFTKNIISRRYPGYEFKLFPVSSSQALASKIKGNKKETEKSRVPVFERFLAEYFETRSKILLYKSVTRQFGNLIRRLETEFELEKKSYAIPLEELEKRNNRLNELLNQILTGEDEIYERIKKDLNNIYLKIQRKIIDNGNDLNRKIKKKIKEYSLNNIKSRKTDFRKNIESKFSLLLKSGLEEIRKSTEFEVIELTKELTDKYLKEYNRTINSIYQAVSESFNISLNEVEIDYDFNFPKFFEYITYDYKLMLEIDTTHLARILGRRYHNKLMTKKQIKKTDIVLDNNLSYIYDSMARRLDKYFRNFNIKFSDSIKGTILKIKDIISKVRNMKIAEESLYESNSKLIQNNFDLLKDIKNQLIKYD